MNGETFNGVEDERERECTALTFAPSPSRLSKANNMTEVDGASEEKQDSTSTELVLKRLIEHSKHREQTVRTTELVWPEAFSCVCVLPCHHVLSLISQACGSCFFMSRSLAVGRMPQ